MKSLLLIIGITLSSLSFAQTEGTDLGIDGYFGASNLGGSFGVGLKYGWKFKENFIAGPSVRYNYAWSKNPTSGLSGNYSVYGGGAFIHARMQNILFAGVEYEALRTPTAYFYTANQIKWISTLFVGGGFSREFNESWRLNLGIMYDVINNPASPFFNSYIIRRENGTRVPVIYRLAFFFPIS